MIGPRFAVGLLVLVIGGAMVYGGGAGAANPGRVITSQYQFNPSARQAGCASLSVFSLDAAAPLFRGSQISFPEFPGQIAATTDLSDVLALPAWRGLRHPYKAFLYRLTQGTADQWQSAPPVTGIPVVPSRALAILPDDNTFLVGLGRAMRVGMPPHGEFGVGKFLLSEIAPDGAAGLEHGFLALDHPAIQIFPVAGGQFAHILTDNGSELITIDVETMSEVAKPITIDNWSGSTAPELELRGAITSDGRYLARSNDRTNRLFIVDLFDRMSRNVALPGSTENEEIWGDVAISNGPANLGLIAIRSRPAVTVYALRESGDLELRGQVRVGDLSYGGLTFPLAWTQDGSSLIIGLVHDNRSEFVVYSVNNEGRELTQIRWLRACNYAVDQYGPAHVYTGSNGSVPWVQRTPTMPRPTWTPVPSPTASALPSPLPSSTVAATSTATTTATLTSTPSATATHVLVPVYLPVLLLERCTPSQRRMDVVLAIDASSSMSQPTTSGRTKLSSAVDAAEAFLDLMGLDEGDQAAVVAFNSDAWLLAPLTADRRVLSAALTSIHTGQFTRLDRAIALARDELAGPRHRTENTAVMVLLTDGRANPEPVEVAVVEAQRAKDAHVVIFSVGLGSDLDYEALRQIASRPEYFRQAPAAEDLRAIYRSIAVMIPCPASAFWSRRP